MTVPRIPTAAPLKGNGIARRDVSIRFFTDTANSPTTVYDPNDDVASVVLNATGEYIVTFNYPVSRVIGGSVQLQMATPDATKATLGATTANSGSDFTATVWTTNSTGTAANVAANANNSILLNLVLEMSSAALVSR